MTDQMHAAPERDAAGSPQHSPWTTPTDAPPPQQPYEQQWPPQTWPPQQPYSPPPAVAPMPRKSRFGIGFLVGFAVGFAVAVAGLFLLAGLSLQGAPADLGDSERADTLYTLCDQGDMGACDLLYLESAIDSPLEEFAATCGGRGTTWQDGNCVEAGIEAG